MSTLQSATVRTQVTRVSDNLSNIAKELEERGSSMSHDGLKLVAAKLRAECAALHEVHTPQAISEEDIPDGVASGNNASNTVSNPAASTAPGTLPGVGSKQAGTPAAPAHSGSTKPASK